MLPLCLPRLRQTFNYDCGAKALQSVLVYYGIEVREDLLLKEAGTSEDGTMIDHLVSTAEQHGLQTDSKQMTIEDVKMYLDRRIPVILVLQAYKEDPQVDWEQDWEDGHYVVAIGYTEDKVLFEDPSSFEHTYLGYDELEKRWHDVDVVGQKYLHHGIAIYGAEPRFQPDELVHMG